MTYTPTDAMVEAAARALWNSDWNTCRIFQWDQANSTDRQMYTEDARAALTAAFAAAIESGEARIAGHVIRNGMWNAHEGNHVDGIPQCLILRTQEGEK